MNSPGFLILIVAFGFIWFMFLRPQKKRQIEAARMLSSVQVGSEVLTAGGIFGEVIEVHDDEVLVRIAPQTEVRVARKAIGAVIPPEQHIEPDLEPEVAAKPEGDG